MLSNNRSREVLPLPPGNFGDMFEPIERMNQNTQKKGIKVRMRENLAKRIEQGFNKSFFIFVVLNTKSCKTFIQF